MEHRPWKPEAAPSRHSALRSLISDQYQYIESISIRTELYDWRNDPLEQIDLIPSPQGRSLEESFKRILNTIIARK